MGCHKQTNVPSGFIFSLPKTFFLLTAFAVAISFYDLPKLQNMKTNGEALSLLAETKVWLK